LAVREFAWDIDEIISPLSRYYWMEIKIPKNYEFLTLAVPNSDGKNLW
jgi:hypothetical protein